MDVFYDPETKQYIGEIYRLTNGAPEKITFEEYKEEIRKSREVLQRIQEMDEKRKLEQIKQEVKQQPFPSEQLNQPVPQVPSELGMPRFIARFIETRGHMYYNPPQRVSSYITGGSVTKTETVAVSVAVGFGVDFSWIKSLNVKVDFEVSKTLENSIAYTIEIPPERVGCMVFQAKMYHSQGDATTCLGQDCETRDSYINIPVPMEGGQLDGMYYISYGRNKNDNLMMNPGFDKHFDHWSKWNDGNYDASKVDWGGQRSGDTKLIHWAPFDYKTTTYQTLELQPGVYKASVWARASDGHYTLQLEATGYGGEARYQSFGGPSEIEWRQMVIDHIKITDIKKTLTIGVHSNARANAWAAFDDFELVQTE